MIFLGVGSSIGHAEDIFKSTEVFLAKKGVIVVKKSSIYKNPPMGGVAKNTFSNAVWQVEIPDRLWDKINWVLLPQKWKNYKRALRLLKICKRAEKSAGRNSTAPKWSDRSLDLDILMFNNLKIGSEKLIVPHPEIANRDFVLNPWVEIIGEDFEIPSLGKLQKLVKKLKSRC